MMRYLIDQTSYKSNSASFYRELKVKSTLSTLPFLRIGKGYSGSTDLLMYNKCDSSTKKHHFKPTRRFHKEQLADQLFRPQL